MAQLVRIYTHDQNPGSEECPSYSTDEFQVLPVFPATGYVTWPILVCLECRVPPTIVNELMVDVQVPAPPEEVV